MTQPPNLSAIEDGQTPLTPEELTDLKPKHIKTIADLNQFENANIDQAFQKYLLKKRKVDLTDISTLKKIHKEMFDQTWKWAGEFRKSDKNLGCTWHQIPEEMKKLCENVKHWEENQIYSDQEIAVRFHYKLVWIHPFSNGNGRHARFVADIFLFQKDLPLLPWGSSSETTMSIQRKNYITALRKADEGDFSSLLEFAIHS